MDSHQQAFLVSLSKQDNCNSFITSTQTHSYASLRALVSDTHAVEEVYSAGDVKDGFFKCFPTGYRFRPSDEDLMTYYLKKKVKNEELPPNLMVEVDIYQHSPEYFAEKYEERDYGENEWYFFTRRHRRIVLPNRPAGDGYWKAIGSDVPVHDEESMIGYKKKLLFYRGKPPSGAKTRWIMHEYRLNESLTDQTNSIDAKLDDWVLCKISVRYVKDGKIQCNFVDDIWQ